MKTSQLQIRIAPAQKATLKRLAASAGQSISEYVLERALPSAHEEFVALAAALGSRTARAPALEALRGFLADFGHGRAFLDAVAGYDASGHPPAVQNLVAAAVEESSAALGVAPAPWSGSIPPLEKPYFGWELRSLRPHLASLTPGHYKRRNVFVDAHAIDGASRRAASGASLSGPLTDLDRALEGEGVFCELCVVAGAIFPLIFALEVETRSGRALFRPRNALDRAIQAASGHEQPSRSWLAKALQALPDDAGGRAVLEFPHLRVVPPPAEYVLAMVCASLPVTDHADADRDLGFLLRLLDLARPDDALAVIESYFPEGQLGPELRSRLTALLS